MSDYLTHIAAIGVGVAIALLFVGRSKNNSESEAEKTATPTLVMATTIASGADTTKKKKKQKTKKKKKASPAAAEADAAAPISAPDAVEAADEEAESPIPAAVSSTAANGGTKKKRKKPKKNGSAVSSSGNATSAAPSPKAVAPPAPTPAPSVAAARAAQWERPAVEEEAWETIPKKGKKKKPSFASVKKQQQTAAPPGSTATSLSVTIDASRIGIIIGPKGATMCAIQEKTGTKLEVRAPKLDDAAKAGNQFRPVGGGGRGNNKSSSSTATVLITEGSPESRQRAQAAVRELAERGYATILQAEGFGESSVSVHPRFLSEIVGAGGKTIRAIQSKLDVTLTIPKTDWTPKTVQIGKIAPSVRVGIAGDSPHNVKTAKQVLRDLCDYHHHEVTHPGFCHEEIYVPQEYFHCVIGPRGSEIKHIRGNYGVDVHMPSNESWCNTDSVVCVGKPNDVKKAISYITLLMDRDAESRQQKYSDEGFGGDEGW